MDDRTETQNEAHRRELVDELEHRDKVRELASFLGTDAHPVAEGLVEVVEHDQAEPLSPLHYRPH